MSDLANRVQEEIEGLRQLRDELRVQLELGRAEARDGWERMETRWHRLEAKAKQLREASREDLAEVGEASRLLMEEIREGYRHLKSLL